MKDFNLQSLRDQYPLKIQNINPPLLQWCYFVFEKSGKSLGFAFAKLKTDETGINLIAQNDDFYCNLQDTEISFEFLHDEDFNHQKHSLGGEYICFVKM